MPDQHFCIHSEKLVFAYLYKGESTKFSLMYSNLLSYNNRKCVFIIIKVVIKADISFINMVINCLHDYMN